MSPTCCLVTGGSGYLGQFVVRELCRAGYEVHFTYALHAQVAQLIHAAEEGASGVVRGHKVALQNQSLEECLTNIGRPVDIVVNCAAVSQPGVVQKDLESATAVNVPTAILESAQLRAQPSQPLLIHLSTDQVYAGTKSYWREEDALTPVNGYGQTKVLAEERIKQRWTNFVILRSSIIFGALPPLSPITRGLFVQWMDGALAGTEPVDFFNDEYRNPIFVGDILTVIRKLCELSIAGELEGKRRVYNMGGPERLSRVDMAKTLAKVQGYDARLINSVPSASAVGRVPSPADISMDVSRLTEELGIHLTPFEDALRMTFHKGA